MRAHVPDAQTQLVNDAIWNSLNRVPPLDPPSTAAEVSAEERGWLVVDMKEDWRVVYPYELE